MTEPKRIRCPECKTTGEVPDESGKFKLKTCPKCGGCGWVPEKITDVQ